MPWQHTKRARLDRTLACRQDTHTDRSQSNCIMLESSVSSTPAWLSTQELTAHNATGQAPIRLPSLQGTPHEEFCHTRPCGFIHKGHSCNTNVLTFLPQAYARALPVYLPVYFLPAILVHRKRLLDTKAGLQILGKVRVLLPFCLYRLLTCIVSPAA